VARHADCWTLPRAVKGASNASLTAASRQRGSSSPVVCTVLYLPLLLRERVRFTSICSTHPSRRGSDGFCSVLQHAARSTEALQLYARAQGKHFFASSTHVPRDVSRDSGATPPGALGGNHSWSFCKERPNGVTPPSPTPSPTPYSLTRSRWTSVVRSSSPIQPSVRDRASWDTFPRKKEDGSFVKLGQEPSTGFFLLEPECFYTCLAHNKTPCESHSAGRCFFGGAVIAPRQTWARLPSRLIRGRHVG
jgi:hypothetical protein